MNIKCHKVDKSEYGIGVYFLETNWDLFNEIKYLFRITTNKRKNIRVSRVLHFKNR